MHSQGPLSSSCSSVPVYSTPSELRHGEDCTSSGMVNGSFCKNTEERMRGLPKQPHSCCQEQHGKERSQQTPSSSSPALMAQDGTVEKDGSQLIPSW